MVSCCPESMGVWKPMNLQVGFLCILPNASVETQPTACVVQKMRPVKYDEGCKCDLLFSLHSFFLPPSYSALPHIELKFSSLPSSSPILPFYFLPLLFSSFFFSHFHSLLFPLKLVSSVLPFFSSIPYSSLLIFSFFSLLYLLCSHLLLFSELTLFPQL